MNEQNIELTDLEPREEVNGGAGLNKVGAGTLILAGANTYGGTTSVSNGATLQVQGGITVAGEGLGL